MSTPDLKAVVREKYGQAALRVKSGEGHPGCCADDSEGACDPITANLYDAAQEGEVPDTAVKASLGCGNPTALAELKEGEVVLDLGSGGGIDVLLSARRVGLTGKAYGHMSERMKIVVIGGNGRIGTRVLNNLRQREHEVVVGEPTTGVNTITGEGVADALTRDRQRRRKGTFEEMEIHKFKISYGVRSNRLYAQLAEWQVQASSI